uniref:Ovule protein n=1 Tax=Ascaris lumbricoides TaxID=6252 RepID=A0A0M3I7M0_ASCLU
MEVFRKFSRSISTIAGKVDVVCLYLNVPFSFRYFFSSFINESFFFFDVVVVGHLSIQRHRIHLYLY